MEFEGKLKDERVRIQAMCLMKLSSNPYQKVCFKCVDKFFLNIASFIFLKIQIRVKLSKQKINPFSSASPRPINFPLYYFTFDAPPLKFVKFNLNKSSPYQYHLVTLAHKNQSKMTLHKIKNKKIRKAIKII